MPESMATRMRGQHFHGRLGIPDPSPDFCSAPPRCPLSLCLFQHSQFIAPTWGSPFQFQNSQFITPTWNNPFQFQNSRFIAPAWDNPFPLDFTHNDQYPRTSTRRSQLRTSRSRILVGLPPELDFAWNFSGMDIPWEWIFPEIGIFPRNGFTGLDIS